MQQPGAAILAAVLGVSVVACSGEPEPRAEPDRSPTSTPSSTSPSPTPTPKPPPTSPFTGERGVRNKPVLAVKIDNAGVARPHTGIGAADLVYVAPVEGGLSRILAMFASHVPKRVGPARSARVYDIPLLRQFGKPALAYSGAHPKLLPRLRKSPFVTVPPSRAPGAYYRGGPNESPHNLYVQARQALNRAKDLGRVTKSRDIGFRFGSAPSGGKRLGHRTVGYGSASTSFHWSKKRKQWLVSMDGEPVRTTGDHRVDARTVVIQYVDIRPSSFRGPVGSATPHVESVGKGRAVVLRDGRAYQARWSRPTARKGTTFTTRSGKPMTFARGQVWVVFKDKN